MSILTHVTLWVDNQYRRPDNDEMSVAHRAQAIIEQPVTDDSREQSMRQLRPYNIDMAGGSKWYCQSVYAACFNYVGVDAVLAHLDMVARELEELTSWFRHTQMAAIICHEGEDRPIFWTHGIEDSQHVRFGERGQTVRSTVVAPILEIEAPPYNTYTATHYAGQRQQPTRRKK